jgi:hypothetical protein
MRAYEILENRNPPSHPLTLRALHKLKHEGKAKEESENRRLELLPKMYGNPARRREELELERLELELKQMRAEIAATVAEVGLKSREAVSNMARSGIAAGKLMDRKVADLARDGMLGRRKKCSTVS